eukprot:CAMPEP_0198246488 /NCGR_PEP_ID=MMETSP1446-20131203/45999_1 /TAXON_ID=1461542 ORGANISM="Unidentified sp, Strain CCMP2111" /NCGR_SAMPLE_ID=MMETSP1446 /ASSEMBLY_ACC=CAM_ASM_001112 /LENGTH=214 /DNA_ID=CAMNT_0043930809 /DNA_START=526 /DNA_END=1170 /DNA_ORIENTATION=+
MTIRSRRRKWVSLWAVMVILVMVLGQESGATSSDADPSEVEAEPEMFQDMSPLHGDPSPALLESGIELHVAAIDINDADGKKKKKSKKKKKKKKNSKKKVDTDSSNQSDECDHQRVGDILYEIESVIDQEETYECPICIRYESLGIVLGNGCYSQSGGEEDLPDVCDFSQVEAKLEEIDALLNEDESYAKCSPCGAYRGSQPGLHWGIAPSNAC